MGSTFDNIRSYKGIPVTPASPKPKELCEDKAIIDLPVTAWAQWTSYMASPYSRRHSHFWKYTTKPAL